MVKRGFWAFGALVVAAMGLMAPQAKAANLYFDMWCEDQGFDEARCEERRPEDVAQFEEYWRAVERYEERFAVDRERDKDFRDDLNRLDDTQGTGMQTLDMDGSPRPR